MVLLGKGSSLRRVAMDGYNISWIPLHKKKQRKRCLPDNQLDKAALERGHGVITHSRQRTPSHHVSLQSRPAMASIQSFSWLSWIFFFFSSFDYCSTWSCSALRGDFRNPHSLNSTYLHQRRKDGNKSYPSKTKTVQILLWPGRRPSFHFSHFESFLLHFSSQRSSSAQGNLVALRPGPSPRNAY